MEWADCLLATPGTGVEILSVGFSVRCEQNIFRHLCPAHHQDADRGVGCPRFRSHAAPPCLVVNAIRRGIGTCARDICLAQAYSLPCDPSSQ
ncbi:hypothetical protein IG631_11673 [Alternaria alternata]|nr:hypothetical protein IG631_11673 [Alternaria alternata]